MIDDKQLALCKQWHNGLDYERYTVLEIIPQPIPRDCVPVPNIFWVIIQVSNTEPIHYCVQYRGGGFYCNTYQEALSYCYRRGFLKRFDLRANQWLKTLEVFKTYGSPDNKVKWEG